MFAEANWDFTEANFEFSLKISQKRKFSAQIDQKLVFLSAKRWKKELKPIFSAKNLILDRFSEFSAQNHWNPHQKPPKITKKEIKIWIIT